MIVADANLLAYLLIPGGHTEAAEKAYELDPDWVAPTLWRSEFLNVLMSAVRARILKPGQADAAWSRAPSVILADQEPDLLDALHLAVKRGISGYDAQYVVLAQALGTVVVTVDKPLIHKCPDLVVSLERFAAG